MLVFVSIAVAAFIFVAASFFFGGDADHDADHGDIGHDIDGGFEEPAISVFSTKTLATLFMGFGASGAIARNYGASYIASSGIGVLFGIVLAGIMYLVLSMFYRQQASSLVETSSAVGCRGTVTVSIEAGGTGEVGVEFSGQYGAYQASSANGAAIPKGTTVKVLKTVGTRMIVAKEE